MKKARKTNPMRPLITPPAEEPDRMTLADELIRLLKEYAWLIQLRDLGELTEEQAEVLVWLECEIPRHEERLRRPEAAPTG